MKNREFTCCFCGKTSNGWGNNPWGAMTKNPETGDAIDLEFGEQDRCCDDCNARYVIPGRIYKMGIYSEMHKEER